MTEPFDLNLRHLRALPAIVARGSLSAGADAVSLSQPALTQGLGKLERQLGIALFDRRSDGVRPTEAGRALAERATRAFELLARGVREAGRGTRGFARPEYLMTATQLAAFLRLADAGSFTGAAAAVGMSQPALHRAVRDVEQLCAIALVERRGRGVALTVAGRRIARGVRLAAAELAAGIVEVRAAPADAGRIVVGALPLARALVLPAAITAFVGGTPRAIVDVVEGSWRELIEPLRDGVIDLMIGALRDTALPGLVQEPLFEDRLVIVARAGHPLAGRPVGLPDLAEHGWIVGSANTPLREQWEALFAGGVLPAAPIECGSVMVIRGVLARSDLLTLLSPDQVALEIKAGMLTTIGDPLPHGVRTIGLTMRAGWRPTPPQARLIALIRDAVIRTRLPEIG